MGEIVQQENLKGSLFISFKETPPTFHQKPAEVPAYVTDGTFWNISKRPMRPGEVRFPISTIDPANTQYDVCTKQLRCMPTDGDYIEKVNSVSPGIHTIIRYLMAF